MNESLSVSIQGNLYHFTVKALSPAEDGGNGVYLYQKGRVEIDNMETIIQQNVLMLKKSPTKIAASLASSNESQGGVEMMMDEETQRVLRDMDLNEIVKTKGFMDMELIEKVLEAKKREAVVMRRRL